MWRREERLEYWLTSEAPPDKPTFTWRLKEKLRSRLRLFPNGVNEVLLRLDTRTLSEAEDLVVDAQVHDGLESIGSWTAHSSRAVRELGRSAGKPRCIELLGTARVRNLTFPNDRDVSIRLDNLIVRAICRSLSLGIIVRGAIRAKECFINPYLKVIDGEQKLIKRAPVGSLLSRMEMYPHKRISLDVGEMSDAERKSFLREGEAMKRIPVNSAELLAVFLHIPIEMISRMRYLDEKKILLYTLCRGIPRTHTRVHDIAAVRDTVSAEMHLIPHRSRFRSVSLN
jgi:hypothetical protein